MSWKCLYIYSSMQVKLLKIAYDINSVKRSSLNQFYTQNALVVPSFINNPYLVIHPSTLEEKEQPWSCSASKKSREIERSEIKFWRLTKPCHKYYNPWPDHTFLIIILSYVHLELPFIFASLPRQHFLLLAFLCAFLLLLLLQEVDSK